MYYMCGILLTTIVIGLSADNALQEFADGNLQFTANAFQHLEETENICMSPLSVQIVMALLAEGAKCRTAQELQRGLSLPKSRSTTRSSIKSLMVSFNKMPDNLKLANRIYIENNFRIIARFEDIAINNYDAGVENVNFGNNLATANLINQWVESQTNNKIQNMISPNQLNSNIKMVLVNTLYFNGNWTIPFPAHKTAKRIFYSSNSDSREIDFMHSPDFATYKYSHYGDLKAKILEMCYVDTNVSMTFILPDEKDGLSRIKTNLSDYLKADKFTVQGVDVALPKFSITTTIEFGPILQKLGIKKAFSPQEANLSGISKQKDLYVDFVSQKTFINVTETGTEAAAATAVGVGITSVPQPANLSFIADHPFLYYIKDNHSGVILFIGTFINN